MAYGTRGHVRDTERNIVLALWLLALVPLALAGWAMMPSGVTAHEPPGGECAIHAHDQAQVGECLDRVTE